MNTIQTLLESSNPWVNLQGENAKLVTKWERVGLLKGLKSEVDRNNMSRILENQAKQLLVEVSQTSPAGASGATFTAGVGEQWAGVALPMVRKIFGMIAAKEFVSVQPMNLPSGLIFFLDFQYGTTKGKFTAAGSTDFWNTSSVFGLTSQSADPSGGLYGAGRFAYSTNLTQSSVTATTGSATWATFNFDSAYSASAAAGAYKTLTVTLPSNADYLGVRSFLLLSASVIVASDILSAFTTNSGTSVTFVVTGSKVSNNPTSTVTASFSLQPVDNLRGDFEDGNTAVNAANSAIVIPQIDVKMKSQAIVAKTKKLKAQWTPEFAQDLNAYHALDAENELTSIMSEYIGLEIDLEILDMLIAGASAGTEYWTAENNQVINSSNTAFQALGSSFYNTQGGWFQTLGTKLQKLSNKIHQKSLRGGANFMVISPTVATIIESIPGFASTSDGDVAKSSYAFGVQKMGALSNRYTVYKNPYMQENTILLGFKGSQFLETGAVFAPYIPLIMTPLIYDPDTFTPRKGLLTRYAKLMVRPEYYGKVYVSGLTTL